MEEFLNHLKKAEKRIGVKFKDKFFLFQALVHNSFAFERNISSSFQKLEFLGDAVLNLVVAEFVFFRFPHYDEGKLAKMRAKLVNKVVLSEVAFKIGLDELILLGKGAKGDERGKISSIFSDSVEALIGAIFLDQGLAKAKNFILTYFQDFLFGKERVEEDYKTELQELSIKKLGALPVYNLVEEEGPVHSRIFTTEVKIKRKKYGVGKGMSKKTSEQQAAKEALKKLREMK